MRNFINIVKESPMGNYNLYGDFSDDKGSLDHKDRVVITNPKHKIIMKKLLMKSNYMINLNISNLSMETIHNLNIKANCKAYGLENLIEHFPGQYTVEEIQEYFDINIKIDQNSINYMLLGNIYGREALTPWMVIHRMMHVFDDSAIAGNHRIDRDIMLARRKYAGYCAKEIGLNYLISQSTMRSARNNNFTDKNEIINETLTQYITKGKIILKSDKLHEDGLNELAKQLFDKCIGKIFVGF